MDPVDFVEATRLEEEEDELRKSSPIEGALGRNASDYHNMWTLFAQIVQRANALNDDPNAFLTNTGAVNDKALNAWTRMISTARSILEGLNKMRNADRMVSFVLDRHTRDLIQAVTLDLGIELKSILDACEQEDDHKEIADRLRRLMYRRLPEICLKSASSTLTSAKEEFGLLH